MISPQNGMQPDALYRALQAQALEKSIAVQQAGIEEQINSPWACWSSREPVHEWLPASVPYAARLE
jgi:hypothetical protein